MCAVSLPGYDIWKTATPDDPPCCSECDMPLDDEGECPEYGCSEHEYPVCLDCGTRLTEHSECMVCDNPDEVNAEEHARDVCRSVHRAYGYETWQEMWAASAAWNTGSPTDFLERRKTWGTEAIV